MQQRRCRSIVPIDPGEIPEDARVRDYDELDDTAQREFLSAVSDGKSGHLDQLARGEIVVFTEYYRVH